MILRSAIALSTAGGFLARSYVTVFRYYTIAADVYERGADPSKRDPAKTILYGIVLDSSRLFSRAYSSIDVTRQFRRNERKERKRREDRR